MNKFNRYKFLKNKLKIKNKYNYPIDRVMGSHLANFVWLRWVDKIRFTIFCLLYEHSVSNNDDTLITFSAARKSYELLLSNYITKKSFNGSKIEQINRTRRSLLDIISIIIRAISFLKYDQELRFSEILLISFLKAYAVNSIKKLEESHLSCKTYIAFNSSYLFESFLAYYFRIRGVPTYSIQHGLYFRYNNEIPLDVINYENVCAENLLCWGSYTINEIKSLVPGDVKLILDGYPYNIKKMKRRKIRNEILVLLPRIIYINEVRKLIYILASSKDNFLLRPHPSNFKEVELLSSNIPNMKLDHNEQVYKTLSDYKFKFCVGFNSTTLLEAVLHDQNIVQFVSGNDEFILSGLTSFTDEKEYSEIKADNLSTSIDINYFFNK